MEAWVPLFDIFLNSPCPESEAALWLQQSFNTSTSTTTTTTTTPTSLLSLLSKPVDFVIAPNTSSTPSNSSTPHSKRIMWIQTLPDAVQSRILSFLRIERRKFCGRELTDLAKNILKENQELDFWVKKSARHLLDELSDRTFDWVSSLSLDSANDGVEEEFEALPGWLQSLNTTPSSMFSWIPPSYDWVHSSNGCSSEKQDDNMDTEVEEEEVEDSMPNQVADELDVEDVCVANNNPIDPEIHRKAEFLKSQILKFESTSKTVGLAREIRQLCIIKEGKEQRGRGGDSSRILSLIEPWEADDETASVLISNLSSGDDENMAWPSQVLRSVILPKLLVLEEPASRVLVIAITEFCKFHQKAAVDGLLFPLILRKEGINTPMCDVITRIIKECLHPAHVSSFCQKLLSGEQELRRYVSLPCHHILISGELVWTESLFTLFQNILNQNVYLTQDSIDHIVFAVQKLAHRYSKSLKFGNFLLCLVTKCETLLKSHKLLLAEAVERTNTFMSKSVLSKVDRL